MFSSRLRQAAGRNRLAVALDRRRAAGLPIIDLTLSNPTRAGFAYPSGLLAAMAQDRSLRYEPEPFGLLSARQAVSDELGRRGLSVPANRIGPDREHERGVFFVVQAAVRPGRCRAGAAAELSAGRAPEPSRRRVSRALPPRVPRPMGGRPAGPARESGNGTDARDHHD